MTAEELFKGICELIPDALSRHKVPGAALGITCDGREFVRGFGVTSIDNPLPVDEKTFFQIGSTTKTLTATAVMRLCEAGKLNLDQPIKGYLPEFQMRDPAVTAAGGVVATIKDQLKYARFHLGAGAGEDGVQVLSPESMAQMHTPAGPANCDFETGLAWRIRHIGGIRRLFHGGTTFGQLSFLTVVPQCDFGFALMTNSTSGALFAREVTTDLMRRFLGNDEPEPAEIPMAPDRMSEYVGRYGAALDDSEIRFEDGKLSMQSHPNGGFPTAGDPPGPNPPPFRVGFVATDRIAMTGPQMLDFQGEFLRAPDGSIAWLRWGGRIHARQ
jgi:CubicO group peptidase (beta-lactamase class C family)